MMDPLPLMAGRLAFVSYERGRFNGDIYVMNPYGSATYNITATPDIHEKAPAWSPDGSRIAFVRNDPVTDTSDIFVMKADGSSPVNLTNTPELSEFSPSWSPDGRQIVFEGESDEQFDGVIIVFPRFDYPLYVMNADGRQRRQIAHASGGFFGKDPVWAPTGRIYYAESNWRSRHIFSINPDGTDKRMLTNLEHTESIYDSAPAVSPDGAQVMFTRLFPADESGNDQSDIMLMNADGSDLVNVTQHPAPDDQPTFSAAGTSIIFTSRRDGGSFDLHSVPVPNGGSSAAVGSAGNPSAAPGAAGATPAVQRLTSFPGDETGADADCRNTKIPAWLQFSINRGIAGEGQNVAAFTVRLSAPVKQTINVQFVTEDGTALAGSDYKARQGSLSFAPGQQKRTIHVPIINDRLDEEHETFFVKVSSLTGTPLARRSGTILDDDRPPRVLVEDVWVTEPASGTAEAIFTLQLSSPSGRSVSVEARTRERTASEPEDYTEVRTKVRFAPGETAQTITVPVHGDALEEGAETFVLEIVDLVNARGKKLRATATIEE